MLVDGRKSPWALHFDKKYFKGGTLEPPTLPPQFSSIDDTDDWVLAFPDLIAGMDDWWKLHPKGEQAHSHAMAEANSGMGGPPPRGLSRAGSRVSMGTSALRHGRGQTQAD